MTGAEQPIFRPAQRAEHPDAIDVAVAAISERFTADARSLNGPAVFVTGNSMYPALRLVPEAESIWRYEDGEAWDDFVLALEDSLERAGVHMGTGPDGSVYVVDLKRWEAVDDLADQPTLDDEWQPRRA